MITIYVATVFCFHKSTESERSLSAVWLSICDVIIPYGNKSFATQTKILLEMNFSTQSSLGHVNDDCCPSTTCTNFKLTAILFSHREMSGLQW